MEKEFENKINKKNDKNNKIKFQLNYYKIFLNMTLNLNLKITWHG